MTLALSGMTKLTQLPWPKGLTTPCLSLPPMYTWASCARRRGAQGSTEGPEFSLSPCTYPIYAWGHLAAQPAYLHLPPPGISCSLCLEPSPASPEQSLLSCSGETSPGSVQCGDGHVAGGGPGGREEEEQWAGAPACLLGGPQGVGLGAGRCRGAARGSCPAVRGPWAPGCAQAHRPLPLWLLLQEAAAWAAVPVLGGGRVVAGRGLDQECVSRNVAALPVGGGAGAGWRVRGS